MVVECKAGLKFCAPMPPQAIREWIDQLPADAAVSIAWVASGQIGLAAEWVELRYENSGNG